MIGRQVRHYQPGSVLTSWESEIPSNYGQARCEDKLSPACEHAVPSTNSRPDLLIRTIAETNMVPWTFGRSGQL